MDDEPHSNLIVIEWFDDADTANRTAATLVEHGMGAVLEAGDPPRTGVAVLGSDAARARQVLGLVEPDDTAEEVELRTMSRSWLIPALIFAAAFVLVPLIAFFVSFKLAGG